MLGGTINPRIRLNSPLEVYWIAQIDWIWTSNPTSFLWILRGDFFFLSWVPRSRQACFLTYFLIHSYTENVVLWAPDFCPLLDSSFYRPLVLFPDPGIFKTIKAGTVGVQNLTILQQKPTLVLIYFSGQSHFSSFLSFFSHLWEFYHFLPIRQCVWFFF